MVHELACVESAAARGVDAAFACASCERVFASAAARDMHARASHVTPVVCAERGGPVAEAGLVGCAVCGLRFRDTEELKAHANRGGLQPVRRVRTYACDACGREFGEERALLQHRNFCERGSASTSS